MKSFIAAACMTIALPALAYAQKTSYDYDKTANFAAYRTYALKDGTKVGDPLIDNRIVDAIESELKTKGLTKAASSPDVTVVYHVAFDKQKDVTAYSTGMGVGYGPYYRWGGGWGTTNVRVNEILVGTLMIDVADERKGEMVWRGIGVKEVDTGAKPEKRDKSIQKAVQKILKNYPPKVKKK